MTALSPLCQEGLVNYKIHIIPLDYVCILQPGKCATTCGKPNFHKVIVDGAPVDANFAKQIGADGYGEDAVTAVELARSLAK